MSSLTFFPLFGLNLSASLATTYSLLPTCLSYPNFFLNSERLT